MRYSQVKTIVGVATLVVGIVAWSTGLMPFGTAIAAEQSKLSTNKQGAVKPQQEKAVKAPTPVGKKPLAKKNTASVPVGKKTASGGRSIKTVVNTVCAACHKLGVLNAPKLGDKADWEKRLKVGKNVLVEHAIKGFNTMPPRGGDATLSDADLAAAVDYMLKLADEAPASTVSKQDKVANEPKAEKKVAAMEPANKEATAAVLPKGKQADIKRNSKKAQKKSDKKVALKPRKNSFNRLLKPPSERNLPPAEDGIHDPDNQGTHILQKPRDAFAPLAKSNSGNRVDWVESLTNGDINPRYDRLDETKKPMVMDLNIVREVKGSMPNVVYPHKQHTEWLDCSNCHPSIFIPKKGANQISMASIIMGEACGVCHGKVAFPVSECRKCHSQNKTKKLAKREDKK